MDRGSGAGAFEAGVVQGVRPVTFPGTLAAPPAPLPLELLVCGLSCPGGPTDKGTWLRTKRVQVRLLLGVRDDQ
jgi:hypothetical protein